MFDIFYLVYVTHLISKLPIFKFYLNLPIYNNLNKIIVLV